LFDAECLIRGRLGLMTVAVGGNHGIVYFAEADIGRVVGLSDAISDLLVHTNLEGIGILIIAGVGNLLDDVFVVILVE
jgi:hypothetical protein